MALAGKYQLEPNLLDIPLYRQRVAPVQKVAENVKTVDAEVQTITECVNPINNKIKEQPYTSASDALERYIKDFERRPADVILAVNYGGTLEHIPVPCSRPALYAKPQRRYLPSVTELLSSNSYGAHQDLSTSTVTSSTISPQKSVDAVHERYEHNPTTGIFWENCEEPRRTEPKFTISPIKPSPFEKLIARPLRPPSDIESIDTDYLCDNAFKCFSLSPQKPSPFEKLVDLSIPPLAGILFDDEELMNGIQKTDSKPHEFPSWVAEIVETGSATSVSLPEAEYKVPDWVRQLEEADGSEVLSIVSERWKTKVVSPVSERKARARILPNEEKAEIRGHVLGLSEKQIADVTPKKSWYPQATAADALSRRLRTKSEDKSRPTTITESCKLTEKSLSWSSIVQTKYIDNEPKGIEYSPESKEQMNVNNNNEDEKFTARMSADDTFSLPYESVSYKGKPTGRITSDRPMEKLKNMLFTVQTLDSSNEKQISFLEDEDLAKLAVHSEPLRKAFEHLSNVRDIISTSPIKVESHQQEPDV